MAEALRPVLPPGTRSDKARQKTRMRPVLSVTREAAQLFIDTCPARFSRQIALVSLLLDGADSGNAHRKTAGLAAERPCA